MGIDLAVARPTTIAILSDEPRLTFLGNMDTNEEMCLMVTTNNISVVAIDCPLFLPKGFCCLEEDCSCGSKSKTKGRICEQLLSKRGISSYYTTKRSIIKTMIYRGIALDKMLPCEVIECYPYATRRILFGKLPPKSTKLGLQMMLDLLRDLISGIYFVTTHDDTDAILAAYTAYLYAIGRAESVGSASEGFLYVPMERSKQQVMDLGGI